MATPGRWLRACSSSHRFVPSGQRRDARYSAHAIRMFFQRTRRYETPAGSQRCKAAPMPSRAGTARM
jgi:hypothetical protein